MSVSLESLIPHDTRLNANAGAPSPCSGGTECRPHTDAGSRWSSVSAPGAYSDTRGTFPERGSCLTATSKARNFSMG